MRMKQIFLAGLLVAFGVADSLTADAQSSRRYSGKAARPITLFPDPTKNPLFKRPEMPWERTIRNYLRPPKDPLAQPSDVLGQGKNPIYGRDPLAVLGFPANKIFGEPGAAATDPELPSPESLERFTRLDSNGDGHVSSGEYIGSRMRHMPLGLSSHAMKQRVNRRYNSRFSSTDSDGDGRISPDELHRARGSRF